MQKMQDIDDNVGIYVLSFYLEERGLQNNQARELDRSLFFAKREWLYKRK